MSCATWTVRRPKCKPTGGGTLAAPGEAAPQAVSLERPVLLDTGVWTWVRDKRFPHLAKWFNEHVRAGRVLVCDLVVLELMRLTPNASRADALSARLLAFDFIPMTEGLWGRARELQSQLAAVGDHRRVPPTDLLLAAAAEAAQVSLVHYDRDYERIANVCELDAVWLVPDGTLG